MSLNNHQFVFATNVSKLIAKANELGIEVTLGEAYRTQSQQLLYYYGKGIEEKMGTLTIIDKRKVSWTKNSNHKKRLAIDLNFFIDGKLIYKHDKITDLGEYWKSLNVFNRWGGDFRNSDTPHFEHNMV